MSATSWGTQPSSLEEIGNAADAKLDCLGIVAYNEDPGEHPQFNMGNNGVANVQIANKRGKSFAGGRYMRVYCAPEARQNPETQTLSNLYLERLRRLAPTAEHRFSHQSPPGRPALRWRPGRTLL